MLQSGRQLGSQRCKTSSRLTNRCLHQHGRINIFWADCEGQNDSSKIFHPVLNKAFALILEIDGTAHSAKDIVVSKKNTGKRSSCGLARRQACALARDGVIIHPHSVNRVQYFCRWPIVAPTVEANELTPSCSFTAHEPCSSADILEKRCKQNENLALLRDGEQRTDGL